METITIHSTPSPWPRRIVMLGVIWGLIFSFLGVVSEPTPEHFTFLIAIILSGLYTVLLFITRRIWLPWTKNHPLRNATLLGILNAAIIEALFLIVEKVVGSSGIAAHPNLLVDWLITMPWYILMVIAFVRVQNRRRFPFALVLLLGAVYETGADGIIGGLFEGNFLSLEFWILLFLLAFWQFIPVYSSMVLPPSWVIATTPAPEPPPSSPWRDALRPLIWLFPFVIYLIVLLLIIAP